MRLIKLQKNGFYIKTERNKKYYFVALNILNINIQDNAIITPPDISGGFFVPYFINLFLFCQVLHATFKIPPCIDILTGFRENSEAVTAIFKRYNVARFPTLFCGCMSFAAVR